MMITLVPCALFMSLISVGMILNGYYDVEGAKWITVSGIFLYLGFFAVGMGSN